MKIGVPKEVHDGEKRVATTPDVTKHLIKLGFEVAVESGAGAGSNFSDSSYTEAGATIKEGAKTIWEESDIILKVRAPEFNSKLNTEEIDLLHEKQVIITFLWPAQNPELLKILANKKVTALAMDSVPRISRAQKMDALSSQANLAGYVMVILAAQQLDRILPMMMTPAGTLSPAKVFVIGAGVAGLQAIATAKRLGARVEAFDTRAVVAEQVQSLGAKFVEIDLGETGQTKDGYANALTPEQLELQRLGMKDVISQADIVITTAQLFGRPAPRIITADMVAAMKPGGVIVDMAVDSGGNVEGSEPDKTVDVNGVSIIGMANLPAQVCKDASQMYSSNLVNLVSEYWDSEAKQFNLDMDDDILQGCVITHGGALVNSAIQSIRGQGA